MRKLFALVVFAAGLAFATAGFAATVKVTVNSSEITDIQISQRAALMRLEHRGSSNAERIKLATRELIDEQLQLQEAERIGIQVTDAGVAGAYTNVARNLKVSTDKLTALLTGSGVNPQTLKDRLKANIAWQGVAQAELSTRVQISDLDLEQKAEQELTTTNSFDYVLKEVRFIVPKGSKVSTSRRTAEANQYRKNFNGCDTAVDLSLSYTDVAVIDVGRRHATQLPDALAKELASLNVGQITKPRVAEGGVSMLAVCAKAAARDTTFVKDKMRAQQGTEQFKSIADDFLKQLEKKAIIVYK